MRTASFVAALLLLCVIASPALSVTHYITDDGLGDYPTIQAAIDASVSGDTIILADGTFSGAGNWDLDFGGRGIFIRSENSRLMTTIDCHGGASGNHRAFHFHSGEDSTAVVFDIQIYDGYESGSNGGGILIENGSNPTIRYCHITDCSAAFTSGNTGWGGGIAVFDSSPRIIDNLVYANTAKNGGGISVDGGAPFIAGNDIYSNSASTAAGGLHATESALVIVDNWFDANTGGGAVLYNYTAPAEDVVIHNNLFTGNTGLLHALSWLYDAAFTPSLTSCTFFNNSGGGIRMESGAGNITNCIFYNTGADEIDAWACTVTYCWIEGYYAGTGNINGTSIAWDYGSAAEPYLPEGNECLDAGSDLASNICAEMQDGYRCLNQMSALQSERPDTGQVDIGYHYIRQRTTLYVPDDVATIQGAIDASVDGDRIEVGGDPMTMHGPINFHGRAVHVISVGAIRMISGGHTQTALIFENGETRESILQNFHIYYGYSGWPGDQDGNGGGIYIYEASPQILNCSIFECISEDSGGGVYIHEGSPYFFSFVISSCEAPHGAGIFIYRGSSEFRFGEIKDCEAYGLGGGAFCVSDSTLFYDTHFQSNIVTGATGDGGGWFSMESAATIDHCSFTNNVAQDDDGTSHGGGLYIKTYSLPPEIRHCTIAGNTADTGAGIFIENGEMAIDNSIVAINMTGEAIACENGGGVIFSCSDIYNNDGGDWTGCIAGQDSINNNFRADPIFRDPLNDIYTVAVTSPCVAGNNPSCGWVGGFDFSHPHNSMTLNADGSGMFETIQDAVNWLAGGDTICLEDGVYRGPGNVDVDFLGKSLILKSLSGDPEDCVIDCEGSSGSSHRGFTLVNREGHAARIEGIGIINGWTGGAGGGINMSRSHPTIKNCIFEKCHAYDGGGIISFFGEGLISNCGFDSCTADDAGGGLFVSTGNPTVRDCWFTENWANWGGGGIYNDTSSPFIERCAFAGNTSDHMGGGVHNNHAESMPTLQNCTFSRNAGLNGGSIFSRNGAAPVVYNSIIAFGTEGVAVRAQTEATTTLYCCDVYGNVDGDYVDAILGQDGANGNFSADPLFCNELLNYLRLTESSPCTQANAGACGLIGAYWEDCHPTTDVEEPDATPKVTRLFSCYPNPFNPSTRIAYDLSAKGHVSLRIYDAAGRLVRTLVEENRRAGRFEEVWNGTDNRGGQVASGVYFYRLTTKDFVESKKMILLK